MDPIPEWPRENVLEHAKLNYGLVLASGQLGWEATPEVAATFSKRWRHYIATCDLIMVHEDDAKELCRFMYTEYGFVEPIMYDGSPRVNCRETTSAPWDGVQQREVGACGGCLVALGGWPSIVTATEMRRVWCSLAHALPLVEEWPFWGTQYPTPTMGYFYDSKAGKICVQLFPYVWPRSAGGPNPLVSDIPVSTALGAVARPPFPPWGSVGSGGFWGCRIHFRGSFCVVLGFLGSEPLLELGSRVLFVPGVPLSPLMVPCTRRARRARYFFALGLSPGTVARRASACFAGFSFGERVQQHGGGLAPPKPEG